MKKILLLLSVLFLSSISVAHPWRTDKYWCHWGSVPRHCYHSWTSSSSSSSSSTPSCWSNQCSLWSTCYTKPTNAFCAYDGINARLCDDWFIENWNSCIPRCSSNQCSIWDNCETRPENAYCSSDGRNGRYCNEWYVEKWWDCIPSKNTTTYPDKCSWKDNDTVVKEVYEWEYCISFWDWSCPWYNYCLDIRTDIRAYWDYDITKGLAEWWNCNIYTWIRQKRCWEISRDMPQYLGIHNLTMKSNTTTSLVEDKETYIPTNTDLAILQSIYPKIDKMIVEDLDRVRTIQSKLTLIISSMDWRNKYILNTILEYITNWILKTETQEPESIDSIIEDLFWI